MDLQKLKITAVSALTLSLCFLANEAQAKLLQIIHTNDLHSHLEHAQDPSVGGYAAVKATIDRVKKRAEEQGVESLVLDAGDFMEGSPFYMAEQGRATWSVMNSMGYDAVVIGNHDWLMGPDDLNRLLGEFPPQFSFLGANFIYEPHQQNIARHLKPYAEFKKNGIKIAVLGLTTDEFLYSWIAKDGQILRPSFEATLRIPEMRQDNELVIALTHIGLKNDRVLVRDTGGIDLVVGGHSHTELHEATYETDQRGHGVPIVHSGEHGHFIGDLLVDYEPGEPLKVIHYNLVPVRAHDEVDHLVDDAVKLARKSLEKTYGADWLYKVVGESEVPLLRQKTPEQTVWSTFLVNSFLDATDADLSFDTPTFSGLDQPPGPITREQIMVLYPRMLDFNEPLGWTVWTAEVRGWVLKKFIQEALELQFPVTFGGITYHRIEKDGKVRIRDIRIRDERIQWWKNYEIALSEGIARGSLEISPVIRKVIKRARDSGVPIWNAVEERMKKVGVIKPERSD